MTQTKPWYLSKTIWGTIISFSGLILKQMFHFEIPDVSSDIVIIIGLVIAVIGRLKAEIKIA